MKSYKIVCHSKNLLDVFIQKLPSKIYKMCSISGIKLHQKKLSSLCQILAGNFNGPFPEFARSTKSSRHPWKRGTGASFHRSCGESTRNVQTVRNVDFSYLINLIRNSSMLRPLELVVQPTFCRFSSANEHEHMSDRWMDGFRGSQQCGQFVLYLRTDFKSP